MLKYLTALLLLAATSAMADPEIRNTPAAELGWDVTPEGVAFAPLMGNRFTEPYMAMVRLPAGLVSPPHIKSADMFGVILSGTMIHHPAGTDPDTPHLGKGSFYRIPAGLSHVSRCISEEDCVTVLYQNGKFDFLIQ